MALFDFDLDSTPADSGEYSLLPDGEYDLMAVEADMRTTKKGDGQYLSVKFEVLNEGYQNRLIFVNYNVHNPNPKAEKIGRSQLKSLATACGLPSANDSDELLNKPFKAVIGVEKGTNGNKDTNGIKKYIVDESPVTAAPVAAAPAPAPKPAPAPAPAKGGNPWN